jgi:hypothetical protein
VRSIVTPAGAETVGGMRPPLASIVNVAGRRTLDEALVDADAAVVCGTAVVVCGARVPVVTASVAALSLLVVRVVPVVPAAPHAGSRIAVAIPRTKRRTRNSKKRCKTPLILRMRGYGTRGEKQSEKARRV